MSKLIDLRSDTISLPTQGLIQDMSEAVVGDCAYGEDESYNNLVTHCKKIFDVEDAIFVTSGMLANRLAVLAQTSPGDEVITGYDYHINFFDSAAMAKVCNVVLNTLHTEDGAIKVDDIRTAIHGKPRYKTFAQVKLVSIENTINARQGKIFPFDIQKDLYSFLKDQNVNLHLDGARIFNAHVETQIPLCEYAKYTDTMSFCASKGLGAPFGSVLLGKKAIIDNARKYQVWLGSGYHQIGFQARAALYALENHINFTKKDNDLAKLLYQRLQDVPKIKLLNKVETNIVGFDISGLNITNDVFLSLCQKQGLLLFPWLESKIRAVVCMNISEEDIIRASAIIRHVVKLLSRKPQ